MDEFCKGKPESLTTVVVDNDIECTCCTKRCSSSDTTCNDFDTVQKRDEIGIERDDFLFSEEIPVESK